MMTAKKSSEDPKPIMCTYNKHGRMPAAWQYVVKIIWTDNEYNYTRNNNFETTKTGSGNGDL